MQKRKRKALQALVRSHKYCEEKFSVLQSVYTEYGTHSLRRVRDKLNHAGVHHEKSKATFSTSVKGTERRFSGSQIPRGL